MRFGPDPRITIPASGFRKRRNQGLTEDRTRSPVQKVKNPLASRAATTEVLTLVRGRRAIFRKFQPRRSPGRRGLIRTSRHDRPFAAFGCAAEPMLGVGALAPVIVLQRRAFRAF